MLEGRIDSSVVYEGPRARTATLTGSPVWGLGDRFAAFAERHGYRLLGTHRPMTPYGLGPQVEAYEAPGGARVLRIPSYALLEGGRVLVVEKDRLVSRPVKTGLKNWQFVEVLEGLSAGDAVTVSLDRAEVKPGARVRIETETKK